MKNILFLFSTLILFASLGCDKGKEFGTLELNFKARYGDDPLVMLDKYDYENGLKILFQRFNFYVSDIQLINSDGSTTILDIDFIDFDGMDTEAGALEGVTLAIEEVPAGTYSAIQIGLGVPSDLNATKESDYSDSHPLGKDSHYWSAWGSYIFCMINAKVDADGDGMHDEGSVLYHTGSDDAYRIKKINIPLTLIDQQTTDLQLDVDLKQLFRDGGGYIDILANPDTHDIEDLTITNKVMDNFRETLEPVQ